MVPVRSKLFQWEADEKGKVTIFVENKGVFNFIAQKFLGKPRISQVHLEEFGSFIWQQIDDKKTVKEIADLLHEKFGEKAEPLYPRICMYMKSLAGNSFVELKKKETEGR